MASNQERKTRNAAFTLVEVMIAMALSVLVIGFVMVFFVDSSKAVIKSTEELRFNAVIRKTLYSLHTDVREASLIMVYPSFSASDRDAAGDRLNNGVKGNLVTLLNTESVDTTMPTHEIVTKITGYFIDPDNVNPDDTVSLFRWSVEPAAGITWYVNPNIVTTYYDPPSNISPNPSFTQIEDYFSSVDASHASITEIARIKVPTSAIFIRNSVTNVTMTVDTLFGNENANMLQSVSLSFTAGG